MKLLLLLLSLVGLAVGQAIISKAGEVTDFEQQQQHHKEGVFQEVHDAEEVLPTDKKIGKRSLGLSPWLSSSYGHGLYLGHGISYGTGWPLYSGWSGGLHGGWSSLGSVGWPILSIGGHGWHSKW